MEKKKTRPYNAERFEKSKEEALERTNEYGNKDLTPYNAIRLMEMRNNTN